MCEFEDNNAEVISVCPNKVKISVDRLEKFKRPEEMLKIGAYLRIEDNENCILLAIIENFSLEVNDNGKRKYLIEANPLGIIRNNKFIRGGDSLTIPPKKVEPATEEEIRKIYEDSLNDDVKFEFSSLSANIKIKVPVDGNKFFNKHIAIVGSTGSGKSHTVATIIQNAVNTKDEEKEKFVLNNSHIIIFDIHSEYKSAFQKANFLDITNDTLILPYWLLNSEELEEILLDTGERDNYNQSSIFRTLVTANKRKYNSDNTKIFYDTPVFFDINEVMNAINNLKNESKNSKAPNKYMIIDDSYKLEDCKTTVDSGISLSEEERMLKYFEKEYSFYPNKNQNIIKGDYADGTLDKFATRFQSKIIDDRLKFLFGEQSKKISFEDILKKLLGYSDEENTNVTIIDLSGVPFEVLSITVSLISRILFDYGYYYKRLRCENNKDEKINNDAPILLVYEEAHKYIPKSDLTKYRSAQKAIERIAKEGRKYGVTLLLASQRPSEISETIFSQCNNFIAMRLTNPNDQIYVKKLLPDTMGTLIDKMPSLKSGEALLIGESVIMPSIVQIDKCKNPPSSNDIPYWKLWKEKWKNIRIEEIKNEWYK
ncbi:ATP-binding protein [Clostridium felsineum]|uniref:anti-phage-associated helicase HerA n=1 Tax=Clostridium felsineum TaxID=36839 RepID=UPI00214DBE40|nr:anti-phage-associated helicase HerA [Clostridium felsineum]MCR3761678.1 ATP-binding protein [Clostridium felsineum]